VCLGECNSKIIVDNKMNNIFFSSVTFDSLAVENKNNSLSLPLSLSFFYGIYFHEQFKQIL